MKIRNLSGAIRKIEGPAFVTIVTDLGPLRLPLMKAGTLTAIRDAAGDDGQRETSLSVTEAGDLVGWWDGGGPEPTDDADIELLGLCVPPVTDDLGDLLG